MIIEGQGDRLSRRTEQTGLSEVVMPTRAVLLAFDGVLADTENVQIAAWQRTFRAMGWHESEESCLRAVGIEDHVFVSEVFARRKIEGGDSDGWARKKQGLMDDLLRDRPRLQPGVAALVQTLKEAGILLGVVTTSRRVSVETVLAASGLLDAFDVIVTADDVLALKSDPAGYRLAVEQLKLEPGAVVAVEDSAGGLSAAEQAGVRVVALVAADPAIDWAGSASARVADLTDASEVLAAIGL